MAHQLSAAVMPRQPDWFAEGLAQFLETARASDDGQSVIVGGMNMPAFQSYLNLDRVSLGRLLQWTGWTDARDEYERGGLYGDAWVFVHWLADTKPEAFAKFQASLAKTVDPKQAFDEAFPGFDPGLAETEMYTY